MQFHLNSQSSNSRFVVFTSGHSIQVSVHLSSLSFIFKFLAEVSLHTDNFLETKLFFLKENHKMKSIIGLADSFLHYCNLTVNIHLNCEFSIFLLKSVVYHMKHTGILLGILCNLLKKSK